MSFPYPETARPRIREETEEEENARVAAYLAESAHAGEGANLPANYGRVLEQRGLLTSEQRVALANAECRAAKHGQIRAMTPSKMRGFAEALLVRCPEIEVEEARRVLLAELERVNAPTVETPHGRVAMTSGLVREVLFGLEEGERSAVTAPERPIPAGFPAWATPEAISRCLFGDENDENDQPEER